MLGQKMRSALPSPDQEALLLPGPESAEARKGPKRTWHRSWHRSPVAPGSLGLSLFWPRAAQLGRPWTCVVRRNAGPHLRVCQTSLSLSHPHSRKRRGEDQDHPWWALTSHTQTEVAGLAGHCESHLSLRAIVCKHWGFT